MFCLFEIDSRHEVSYQGASIVSLSVIVSYRVLPYSMLSVDSFSGCLQLACISSQ